MDTIPVAKKNKDETESTEEWKEQKDQSMALFELWVLAEKLLIPRLQNLVITELLARSNQRGKAATFGFRYFYENTSAGSPLRLLLVDQCAGHLRVTGYAEMQTCFPQEMLIDIMTVMAKAMPANTKRRLQPESPFKYQVEEN